jgi:hypothetical protein
LFNQVLEKVTGAPAEVPEEAAAEPEPVVEEKPKGRKKAKA